MASLLGACGAPPDRTPPALAASGFVDGAVVDAPTFTLAVRASDDRGVDRVTYLTDRGVGGACVASGGDAYACGPIALAVGDNALLVRAVDGAGLVASLVLHVVRAQPADVEPPDLTLYGLADGTVVTAEDVVLTAVATDAGGIEGVSWATDHGASGACGPPLDDAYPCGPIPLPIGDTWVTVTASDAAGNEATDVRRVRREAAEPGMGFDVRFVFFDHLFVPTQLAAFEAAAVRWEALLVGDLQPVTADLPANASCGQGEPAFAGTIDDVVVFVTTFTDGAGGLLGYAGPCLLRSSGVDAGLPALGFMAFDALDLAALEAAGALVPTIVHELGHVLGFGTLWELAPRFDLLDYVPDGAATDCRSAASFVVPPTFTGAAGVAAWLALGGSGGVPVEDEGGPGTRCGHWDEATFGPELMTGYLDPGTSNPLSALSARSFEDLGYAVDPSAADPYALPGVGVRAVPGGIDLAAREVLLAPRGTLEPASGGVGP